MDVNLELPSFRCDEGTQALTIRRYLVIYTSGRGHFSGYAPDIPGCGAIGRSMEELRENMYGEITFRLEQLAGSGQAIPEPVMGMEDVPSESVGEWMVVRPKTTANRMVTNNQERSGAGAKDNRKLFLSGLSELFRMNSGMI